MSQAISRSSPHPASSFPAPQPEGEAGTKLRLGRSLKMHRTLALTVFAITFAGLTLFGLLQKPQYLAESLLYIQPATPKPLTDVTSGLYDSSRYDSYIQQQLETVVRADILTEALKKVPPGMWVLPGEPEDSAVARLKASLKVERVLSSYEVKIGLWGADPRAVTRVVNEVTTAFLHAGRGDELAQGDQQVQSLAGERQRIEVELTKDRSEQAGLSASLGVADTANSTTGNPYDTQLQSMRDQLATARQAHAVAEAQLAAANQGVHSSELLSAASDQSVSTDPALIALKVSVTQRRSALANQMAGMTVTNPLYKQDEDELARLDQSLAGLTQSLHKKVTQQLEGNWKLEEARTRAVEARLASQLAQQTSVATGATPKLQRASDLAADISRLQARYAETDNAMHSLELQQSSGGLIHLSLPATQPQKPATGKRQIVLAMALPLGLLCGAFAAVTMQKLDVRIYIAEDMDDAIHFAPMVVLPHPDEVNASVMKDSMLRLVGGIDQAYRMGGAKTFVFTGASPGMNTSRLVDALAQRMREIGYKVMVTKASAALKSMQEKTQAVQEPESEEQEPGMALESGAAAELLPAAHQGPVLQRLNQTAKSVDILFIDAQPLLCSAEAEFDTRLVDVTVVLAESGRTTRRDLSRSVALIKRLSSAGVASILMGLRLQHADPDFLSTLKAGESTA